MLLTAVGERSEQGRNPTSIYIYILQRQARMRVSLAVYSQDSATSKRRHTASQEMLRKGKYARQPCMKGKGERVTEQRQYPATADVTRSIRERKRVRECPAALSRVNEREK